MGLHTVLLSIHIIFGGLCLITGFVAITARQFRLKHKLHIQSGRLFYYGMIGVFLTAFPMTYLKPNLFLFLISIFSFYIVHTGQRYAKNREGHVLLIDRLASLTMTIISILMIAYGVYMLSYENNNDGITLQVFGSIGLTHALLDLFIQMKGGVRGKKRVAMHLTMMFGGVIATVTAFVVTNFNLSEDKDYILWISPGVLFLPLMTFWNYKVLKSDLFFNFKFQEKI